MANYFQGNPWVVDTVMATPYLNLLLIKNMVWTEQAAPGDQLIITDGAGHTLLDIKAQTANIVQALGGFGWVNGLQVTTLTSGKVYLYIR